jgi:hypothetical protein
MDINKFTEAARYMSLINKYENDLELLGRESKGVNLVLFSNGNIVSELHDEEIVNNVKCVLKRKIGYYQHKFNEL